jgi:hypothetical protein
MAGSSIVKYEEPDFGAMQEEEKKLPTGGGGNFVKLKEGKNILRALPSLPGKPFMKTWYKHFFQLGAERKTIVCARMQANEPCAVCDKGKKLLSSGNRLDTGKAKAFEPKPYVYINVVDMKNPEAGVKIWSMSSYMYKDLIKTLDMNDVQKVFTNPTKGFNIIVLRTGTGANDTRYKLAIARESSELPDAEAFINTQPDLETAESLPSDEDSDNAADGKFESLGSSGGGRKEKEVSGKRVDADDDDLDY